jgi:hypothetical protein
MVDIPDAITERLFLNVVNVFGELLETGDIFEEVLLVEVVLLYDKGMYLVAVF